MANNKITVSRVSYSADEWGSLRRRAYRYWLRRYASAGQGKAERRAAFAKLTPAAIDRMAHGFEKPQHGGRREARPLAADSRKVSGKVKRK